MASRKVQRGAQPRRPAPPGRSDTSGRAARPAQGGPEGGARREVEDAVRAELIELAGLAAVGKDVDLLLQLEELLFDVQELLPLRVPDEDLRGESDDLERKSQRILHASSTTERRFEVGCGTRA